MELRFKKVSSGKKKNPADGSRHAIGKAGAVPSDGFSSQRLSFFQKYFTASRRHHHAFLFAKCYSVFDHLFHAPALKSFRILFILDLL